MTENDARERKEGSGKVGETQNKIKRSDTKRKRVAEQKAHCIVMRLSQRPVGGARQIYLE